MQMMGKRRFVLVDGLLYYGGAMFLLWAVIFSIQERGWLSLPHVAMLLGLSALFGLFYGVVTWRIHEKKLNRLTSDSKEI